MTVSKKTTFERIQFIYSRNDEEFLTLRKQSFASASAEVIWSAIASNKPQSGSDLTVTDLGEWLSFELEVGQTVVGVITEAFHPSDFDTWFIQTILKNGFVVQKAASKEMNGARQAKSITDLFERTLRNVARVDRWNEGKYAFLKNVEFFTHRGIPVQAVLPAFPCKSSNHNKVASCLPDKGEELAIQRIIDFISAVKEIYPPGMEFYLVSDGHVFSDCIHVDDEMVDQYFTELEGIYERVKPEGFTGLIFKGLNDCFKSELRERVAEELDSVIVEHHLPTQLDKDTEFNRKVLMLGCDDNVDRLRKQIQTPNHPRLYLYRGFNKFMCEDLAQTTFAKSISKKKYKKMILAVAFEMIRRNDAYSNLVELIFPFHLRFSIHAHHNAGPKYGVRLLDPEICTTAGHDQNEEDRLLHIPTPWHNSIFKIVGSEKYVVAPSRFAEELEKTTTYKGGWDAERKFYLYRRV